ncbi:MAG: selenocysteine-specific translation elongation factor [Dehalococcoidia bacterium]|nr:selenocysteine-specific translation elongation factor [Dehalococcoidia bacterium]
MYVIGTAGHVDHGKSTLIHKLTDIDPDRLPQEKERGLTIELGFAWLTLPSGREVSIVDVPGHERFVRTMLTGIGSIDLALLVISADEGIMPQTREHLAILDLLEVKKTIVVITKADLVDEDFLEIVQMEIEDALKGTVFHGSQTVKVSAISGYGMEHLKQLIDTSLSDTESREDLGRPRLAIDRIFSKTGFGTVVTGTLLDGSLTIGQEVEIIPSYQKARIRGLQIHKQKVTTAQPGRRVAVNLSGIDNDNVNRGHMITNPGWFRETTLVDARIKLIKSSPRALKHNIRVTFHLLGGETFARVRLLDRKQLLPGEEGWAQIHLEDPIGLVKGDFFVVRDTTTTLGGGRIVNPYPKRHKPFVKSILTALEKAQDDSPEEVLLSAINQSGSATVKVIAQNLNKTILDITETAKTLAEKDKLILLGTTSYSAPLVMYSMNAWIEIQKISKTFLVEHHKSFPLRKGGSKEELRSRLKLPGPLFSLVVTKLMTDNILIEELGFARLPNHKPSLNTVQSKIAAEYIRMLDSKPFNPPTNDPPDQDLLSLLIDEGKVVKVSTDIIFSASAYTRMQESVTKYIKQHGKINVSDARTLFDSSRKYILPLLEHMDERRITKRVGDDRILR